MDGTTGRSTKLFIEDLAKTLTGIVHNANPDARAAFYQGVLEALPFAVVIFDASHRYRYVNPAAIKNPQIRQWIIGKDDFEYCVYRGFDMKVAETRREGYLKSIQQREPLSFEEQFVGSEGETLYYWRHFFPVYQEDVLQMVIGYSMDVSPLKRAEAALIELNQVLEQRVQDRTTELQSINSQLSQIALYDSLTGLPNRTLLKDRLTQAFKAFQRDPQFGFAVLFLDADGFKGINDTFGHDTGDEFLQAFSRRLVCCVRESDTVARFGGDEFVMVLQLSRAHAEEQAIETAERILSKLERPFRVAGRGIKMTASIGIVADMSFCDKPEDILRDADIAMYQAKRGGRATYRVSKANLQNKRQSYQKTQRQN